MTQGALPTTGGRTTNLLRLDEVVVGPTDTAAESSDLPRCGCFAGAAVTTVHNLVTAALLLVCPADEGLSRVGVVFMSFDRSSRTLCACAATASRSFAWPRSSRGARGHQGREGVAVAQARDKHSVRAPRVQLLRDWLVRMLAERRFRLFRGVDVGTRCEVVAEWGAATGADDHPLSSSRERCPAETGHAPGRRFSRGRRKGMSQAGAALVSGDLS